MSLPILTIVALTQIFQLIAWTLALLSGVFALFALIYNFNHPLSRPTGTFLITTSLAFLLLGWLLIEPSSEASSQAFASAIGAQAGLAVLLPLIQILSLSLTIALIQPTVGKRAFSQKGAASARTDGRQVVMRLFTNLVPALAIIPALIVLIDRFTASTRWFTPLLTSEELIAFVQGTALFNSFMNGESAQLFQAIFVIVPAIVAAVLLAGYLIRPRIYSSRTSSDGAALDPNSNLTPAVAGFLLFIQILTALLHGGAFTGLHPVFIWLTSLILPLTGFTLASLRIITSETSYQRTSLVLRLNLLIIAISLPTLIFSLLYLNAQAQTRLEQESRRSLAQAAQSLSSSVELWLEYNLRALTFMAGQADIISMDPVRQKPVLEAFVANYPEMYLASITDLTGLNTARSDNNPPTNYSDRSWYLDITYDAPFSFQTLLGRTTNRPALVGSVPVHDASGTLIGVAMFATELDIISARVRASQVGGSGYGYVINERNQVVAHPQFESSDELVNLSEYPAVKALRQGVTGPLTFTDPDGLQWQANLTPLPNDWAVIVQVPTEDFLAPVRNFQLITGLILALSTLLLISLPFFTLRQSLRPIQTLTTVASRITQGDLSARAELAGQDELGQLADGFNSMTLRLSDLISEQDQRIAARTQDLARRLRQLRLVAEIARDANAIADPAELLDQAVRIIASRFGYYHVGIFLLDQTGTSQDGRTAGTSAAYAVLRAASSPGGQRMLARNHKLRVGSQGLVGYVAASRQPRIALDVGADAVFFNNPDLPTTRSEAALPLVARRQVLGVLDVQSEEASAFTSEDIEILQILADQIALAIDNTRLLGESQAALAELEKRYGTALGQAWRAQLGNQVITFLYDPATGIRQATEESQLTSTHSTAGQQPELENDPYTLTLPIQLRTLSPSTKSSDGAGSDAANPPASDFSAISIGDLTLHRDPADGPWIEQERQLAADALSQLALALDNARLLEEVQRRADQEQLVSQIAARLQSSLSLETVIHTALSELGQAFRLPRLNLNLSPQSLDDPIPQPKPDPSSAEAGPAAAAPPSPASSSSPDAAEQ